MRDIAELSEHEELAVWVKKTFDEAIEELMRNGVVESLLVEAKPAWVYPFQILIGKIREKEHPGRFLWFICGDAPTDHISGSHAASPKEAAKHFALKWQLDASRVGNSDKDLSAKATALYEFVEEDRLWEQI